jgi:hypothetical protein
MSSTTAIAMPTPLSSPGLWPIEAPEQRNHRIGFYGKYGVPLDPNSLKSFVEQVKEHEHRMVKRGNKVMSLKDYENYVSYLQKSPSPSSMFSLKSIHTPSTGGPLATETIALMKTTKEHSESLTAATFLT